MASGRKTGKKPEQRSYAGLGGALLAAALLAACGGGGGGESAGTPGSASPAASSRASAASSTASASATSSAAAASSAGSAASANAASSASSARSASSAASSSATSGLVTLDADSSCGLANFRADVLAAVNQARASARMCGSSSYPAVASLSWEDRLFSAAARHARDMAENNYFDHNSLDGRTPGQRITAEGYVARAWGENIAAGYGTVAAVMQGWLESPGHCSNIMSASFTELGVSCVSSSGSRYGQYWVMTLGAR